MIDVKKLKGKYYDNSKEDYYDGSSTLVDAKGDMSISMDDDNFAYGGNSDGVDEMIIDYIQKQPFRDYNNMLDKDTELMSKIEMSDYFLQTYLEFYKEVSTCAILVVFCDYFNFDYINIIRELPNFIQMNIYNELSKIEKNRELLNDAFSFNIDVNTPKLF